MFIHQPVVRKVALFRILLDENWAEVIVKKLVPVIIGGGIDYAIANFYDICWQDLLGSILLLIFMVKVYREVLFNAERGLAKDFLELRSLKYFLAFAKQRIFRFSKFLFKAKLAGKEQLANNNNIEETVL